MTYDRRNATSSWSGYNHQGKVGIFLALTELRKLLEKEEDHSTYKLIFEKNGGEDVEICQSTRVISRHQVKAKKKGSIIFVVGKSPIDIMEPILCRKKVP